MVKSLSEYRRKRDFSKTTEPAGLDSTEKGHRFVVHKHSATADHYDLRLQVGDALKCWAVPKGPSLDPDDKRLAVETEDHPVDYASFEGVIPKGQYGAGAMIVWDQGSWAPMGGIAESLEKGQFKFRLVGEKLRGGWMLTRLKRKPGDRQNNWLLIKERDFAADPSLDILQERPESVKSGRSIEQLVVPEPPSAPGRLSPGALKGSVKGPFPKRIAPQLATSVDLPPEGDDWLHEIKFDGYRTLAHLAGGQARLLTRSGLDWTHRYGDLAAAFGKLKCRNAVIDGEIVVLDEKGISRFALLQEALGNGAQSTLVFVAFDMPHINGWDLREVELAKRKDYLRRLLADVISEQSAIQYSDHVAGNGATFFDTVCEMGLEGVVSKRAAAAYKSGRTSSWTKAKAPKAGDFVITGYTTSHAAGGLAALALGEWQGDELKYVGKVGSGFDARTADELLARLQKLRDQAEPPGGTPNNVTAVRPVLTAKVRYANRTPAGSLRHAVFRGLREANISRSAPSGPKRLITDADLAAIWVTNPSRRLFGRAGPTKLDIALYYARIGDFMLPHILERPVTLVRCPSGNAEDCFYQRHAFAGMPDTVATFTTTNSEDESQTYLAIEDAKGFLALAQFGVVEFHVWGSLKNRLEKTDRVIFDLDPGEGIAWRQIVEAAVHVRGELARLGLVPFVKTTGGKGVHVVVPIRAKLGWKRVHKITGAIAEVIAATAPDVFVTSMAKRHRKGRIFIDFHRNARGATAAAPYTLRAGANLPVSAPLNWSDLESVDAPQDLNYSSLPPLLADSGDPWADINRSERPLPAL